jgi:hypothetical protein
MVKNMIQKPKIFKSNIIILNQKDFENLDLSNKDGIFQTFQLLYVGSTNTIKNLKII